MGTKNGASIEFKSGTSHVQQFGVRTAYLNRQRRRVGDGWNALRAAEADLEAHSIHVPLLNADVIRSTKEDSLLLISDPFQRLGPVTW